MDMMTKVLPTVGGELSYATFLSTLFQMGMLHFRIDSRIGPKVGARIDSRIDYDIDSRIHPRIDSRIDS